MAVRGGARFAAGRRWKSNRIIAAVEHTHTDNKREVKREKERVGQRDRRGDPPIVSLPRNHIAPRDRLENRTTYRVCVCVCACV